MTQWQKKRDAWARSKQPVTIEEVISVAGHVFEAVTQGVTRGSHHLRIRDARLVGHPHCGPIGDFTIPTKGKQVKYYYLKIVNELIDYVQSK